MCHQLKQVSPLVYASTGLGLLGVISICAGVAFLLPSSRISAKDAQQSDITLFTQQKDSNSEVASVSASVFVYVSGGVKRPDVYKLEKNSLVRDAIMAAGGFSRADGSRVAKELNLADIVHSAQHIHVPVVGEVEAQKSEKENVINTTDDKSTLVRINSATSAQLQELPGIGEERAKKIISNRPYNSFDELKQKSQIPASTLNSFKNLIIFSTE